MKLIFTLILMLGVYECVMSTGSPHQMSEEDIKETLTKNAINEALLKYNSQSNAMYQYALYNVDKATSQVVAGILYNFELTVVPTQCRNNADNGIKTLNECHIGQGHPQRCHIKVYSQPWMHSYETTIKNCEPVGELKLHDNLHHVGIDGADLGSLDEFYSFKTTYDKKYSTTREEKARFAIFKSNTMKAKLISLLDLGSAEYGTTVFSDMTEEEFRAERLSPEWDQSSMPKRQAEMPVVDGIPSSWDWRQKGAVTPVKNQGQCGSCWAFSTTGNVEGQWFITKKKLVSLSEQELVDCDKVDQGCNGGLPSNAYKEIMRLGGLETEKSYPYTGRGESCHMDINKVAVYINDSVAISKDEGEMAAWLAANSPISIGINAFAMQFYRGGVSHPWAVFCNKAKLDHGVLIVGYGVTDTSEPFWIIKNSWGPTWGEKGYYRVFRGDGTCGLNTMCTSAVVK